MNSTERKAKTEKWLRSMGCNPTVIDDPHALWHIQVNYPPAQPHIMHVVCPKQTPEAVVIATKSDIGADLLQNFAALDSDAKDDFLWELRNVVNVTEVEFQLDGAESPQDCPRGVQISRTRYDDGLTLDSFAHSVGAVFKTELNAMWVVARHLSSKGYGTGDRFDFRKLGM
jgi:hypothetical protein